MWGGIYAVLFSISTVLSYENPIKNGFSESITESYLKHSLSAVEFQNKLVGQEVQFSFYENMKYVKHLRKGGMKIFIVHDLELKVQV